MCKSRQGSQVRIDEYKRDLIKLREKVSDLTIKRASHEKSCSSWMKNSSRSLQQMQEKDTKRNEDIAKLTAMLNTSVGMVPSDALISKIARAACDAMSKNTVTATLAGVRPVLEEHVSNTLGLFTSLKSAVSRLEELKANKRPGKCERLAAKMMQL